MDIEGNKEMTIRPFKLIYNAYDHSSPRKQLYYIENHRGIRLPGEIKIADNDYTFFHKLLSYPITAFGYEHQFEHGSDNLSEKFPGRYINPRFDKKDVIKALDFWIEYWVYQNKCDYILEGTVNKDFELTVRELIETRDAVMKMPADSEFVRQKIRVDTSKGGKNFNYEKEINGIRKFYHYDGDENRVITNMSKNEIIDCERGLHTGKPFPKKRDNPLKPQWDEIVEYTENVLNNRTASTVDQFCYVVRKMTYKEYMKRNEPINRNIKGVLTLSSTDISTLDSLQQQLMNLPVMRFDGGEWTSSVPTSNLPEFDISSSTEIHYPNMRLTFLSDSGMPFPSPTDWVMIPIGLVNSLTTITTNLFMTDRTMFSELENWEDKDVIIRLDNENTCIIINSIEYHMTDLNIHHDPIIPQRMIYRDLFIQTLDGSRNINTINRLNIGFRGVIGINIVNIDLSIDSTMTGFFNLHGVEGEIGKTIASTVYELEILGNNRVRIGDGEYTVFEPINISISI